MVHIVPLVTKVGGGTDIFANPGEGAAMYSGFAEFFRAAVGDERAQPYAYQERVAASERFPDVIEVPPGAGKTAAIVLSWLWRLRFDPDSAVRAATPRRLVYCLPFRALSEQVTAALQLWLGNLGIPDAELPVYTLMGGTSSTAAPWRSAIDQPSVVIGTVEMLTSRGLMRAYGAPRNAFPIDAALVWNDSLVVVDEVQAAPATTRTWRQIDAFRRSHSYGPTALTCMTATLDPTLVSTVDNPYTAESHVIRLGSGDDRGELAVRRAAQRAVAALPVAAGDSKALANAAIDNHRPNSLTLVIVNSPITAREVYSALGRLNTGVATTLLHSGFRSVDRRRHLDAVLNDSADGRIVVSTQVVEAGVDLDARTLITEVAPWPSLIQRSGRCNRTGHQDDARLLWCPTRRSPYVEQDLASATEALRQIEACAVTNEDLLAMDVAVTPPVVPTLRRADFEGLFDTTPDLSGNDLDITPYVRDIDSLDVQIGWLDWSGTTPDPQLRPPVGEWLCRVPLGSPLKEFSDRGVRLWRYDRRGQWSVVDGGTPARPGEVLVVRASDGGYLAETGYAPKSTTPVPVQSGEGVAAHDIVAMADDLESPGDDEELSANQRRWVSLDQHLTDAAAQAASLVTAVGLQPNLGRAVVLAARLHDVGKAHPIWQDALCATGGDSLAVREFTAGGRPWAKSASPYARSDEPRNEDLQSSRRRGRLGYGEGVKAFRHEFASLLLLDGALASLIDEAEIDPADRDLVRYLVLAHHGKLRVQIRDRSAQEHLFGIDPNSEIGIPSVLGAQPGLLQLSPDVAGPRLGGVVMPWVETVMGLLNRFGVFRLAYLEALVRIADWRASASPGGGQLPPVEKLVVETS